jgi:predicted protein tyrosine phosphatase
LQKIHYIPNAGGNSQKCFRDPGATPRFCQARTVPYSMKGLVKVTEGTLEPVELSEWAALIVALLKGDKRSVQIAVTSR